MHGQLKLEPNHEIVLGDAEIIAVRQCGVVQVWAEDGEYHYFDLPEDASAETIKVVKRIFECGHSTGYSDGVSAVKSAMQTAIGLMN